MVNAVDPIHMAMETGRNALATGVEGDPSKDHR